MKDYKGLGLKLTEEERLVLKAFINKDYIALPVDCGLSIAETIKILQSLTKRDIIKGRGPYRLTKKGERIIHGII